MTTRTKKQTSRKKIDNEDQKNEDKRLSSWRVKTLEDAFLPRPPREYIVEGLFPKSSLNIVFGAEGSMKSLLLMDMGICISEGFPWLQYVDGNGYQFETKKTGVLYIDLDNGSLTDDERINAFALSHGLSPDNKSNFKYMSMPEDFDIAEKETLNRVWMLCQALQIGVLIMDNLGLINSKDENSHEMAGVMSKLRSLADKGLCVIIIHHQRKGNASTKDTRLGENLRGHSSIPAALDISLFVSRRDINDDNISILPAKSRFAPIEPFAATFKYTWRSETKELETALFVSASVDTEAARAASLILMLLSTNDEMTKTDLVNAMMKSKIGQKSARMAIDKAIEEGIIDERKAAHNTKMLRLNEDQYHAKKAETLAVLLDAGRNK